MKKLLIVFSSILMLGCSQLEPQCPALVSEYTNSYDKHADLAIKYSQLLDTYRDKLKTQKEILKHYEDNSDRYGKSALDLPSHTKANINYYQSLIDKAEQEIRYHKLASEFQNK